MSSNHPYTNLPSNHFWRNAVADYDQGQLSAFWTPKFEITQETGIATAGSCFAQNFSKALVRLGYNWRDFEPGPAYLTKEQRFDYHYGTFSFRTGNIYTARMLKQWLQWAFEDAALPDVVWTKDGRFFDPFRPSVEPSGFASPDEIYRSRAECLTAIRAAVTESDVFVFTLGLTEAWWDKDLAVEYAICPGTVAGSFDRHTHIFRNWGYEDINSDLADALELMRKHNPSIRILLTVSPVPLVATASDNHVVVATMHSKSILRAVAGQQASRDWIDYFPSYEIFASPLTKGGLYSDNMRNVSQHGVDLAMQTFFDCQKQRFGNQQVAPNEPVTEAAEIVTTETDHDIRCEEEILAAFNTDKT